MNQPVYDNVGALAAGLSLACAKLQDCVVSVDGFDGSGKTTLAKQLAVQLAGEHIEVDLFLERDRGGYVPFLRYQELTDQICAVIGKRKVVVIDGVCVKAVLRRLGILANVQMYVKRLDGTRQWSDGAILYRAETFEQALKLLAEEWAEVLGDPSPWIGLDREVLKYHFDYRPHETAEYIFQWVAPQPCQNLSVEDL